MRSALDMHQSGNFPELPIVTGDLLFIPPLMTGERLVQYAYDESKTRYRENSAQTLINAAEQGLCVVGGCLLRVFLVKHRAYLDRETPDWAGDINLARGSMSNFAAFLAWTAVTKPTDSCYAICDEYPSDRTLMYADYCPQHGGGACLHLRYAGLWRDMCILGGSVMITQTVLDLTLL